MIIDSTARDESGAFKVGFAKFRFNDVIVSRITDYLKKGGVVFKPCIAECFWSDLYVFSKLGDRDSGIYGSSGNQCSYGSDSGYFGLSGNPGIIRPGSLSYALTDENAVKSRSCGILEGRMRKVIVKMCQRLFFYGKTLVRRKNNGYNPSYNRSRWLYQISYKI